MIRKKKAAGFTLIEILLIIAIISILVAIVLVSLVGAKQKAQDASAFTSVKSAAAPAFACLTSGIPNVQLNAYSGGAKICSDINGAPGAFWPDLAKTGWSLFSWCLLSYGGSGIPTGCATYDGSSCGGAQGAGNFCFMMQNGSKYIWCTVNGCGKTGF
jgi:type II secretory pathway pseudopilin PulG